MIVRKTADKTTTGSQWDRAISGLSEAFKTITAGNGSEFFQTDRRIREREQVVLTAAFHFTICDLRNNFALMNSIDIL
jgi:hypothetical protein